MTTKKEWSLLLSIPLVLAAADQIIKVLIRSCYVGQTIFRFEPVFEIVHSVNKGAAFSLLNGQTLLLQCLTSALLIGLMAYTVFAKSLTGMARKTLAVLAGGGIGNWIDRITFGGVTDYIRLTFIRFPVFNFADICITMSIVVLIILILTGHFETHTGEEHGTDH